MTRKRHHPLIRVLHWLVASLIIAALTMSALVMPLIPADSPELVDSLRRHMSAGLLVLVLTLLRFVMRRSAKKPPVLSSGMAWADWLARATHRVFDVLILLMIASGVGMAWNYRAVLAQPLSSSFGMMLTLKIALALSVLGHFAVAMRTRGRGEHVSRRFHRIHVSVFCHMLGIVLLAKGMFYFSG